MCSQIIKPTQKSSIILNALLQIVEYGLSNGGCKGKPTEEEKRLAKLACNGLMID